MYFVYILKSVNFAKTYTGISDNVERRLIEHNNGYSYFSKRYRPWIVLFTVAVTDKIEARKKEKYFKSAAGRRWIRKTFFS